MIRQSVSQQERKRQRNNSEEYSPFSLSIKITIRFKRRRRTLNLNFFAQSITPKEEWTVLPRQSKTYPSLQKEREQSLLRDFTSSTLPTNPPRREPRLPRRNEHLCEQFTLSLQFNILLTKIHKILLLYIYIKLENSYYNITQTQILPSTCHIYWNL